MTRLITYGRVYYKAWRKTVLSCRCRQVCVGGKQLQLALSGTKAASGTDSKLGAWTGTTSNGRCSHVHGPCTLKFGINGEPRTKYAGCA